ncbi:MAG: (Fe-S)-binding protein [Candidatus Lokiarchaeota archaeon]|nr:(Fe-S)-binding protein [Candidatus Lokiarchaeota archaeon]
MDDNEILKDIRSCIDCKNCIEKCDTFIITKNEVQSPNGRLKIAESIFLNKKISENELISIYTCTLCAMCDLICAQNINISDIIHASKVRLVDNNIGPLKIHEKIIQGIIEKNNSVGGNPEERLNWLPKEYEKNELFEKKDSDTLLFFGCMSSFKVKESATKSYQILKEANFNFKILKKEPCCGEYIYSAGKLDVAKKIFKENIELFKRLGINNIIVTCGGCLYAFDSVYRKYFDDYDIRIRHIIDVIYELEKEGKIQLKPLNKSITYHDPCRLGRKYKNNSLIEKARLLLKKCILEINELSNEPQKCPCCGAGSGIRGVDSNLCIKIGKKLFDKMKTKEIVSSCPLCIFNFKYVNYKNQMDKGSKYILDYIVESMKK